MTRKCCWQLLKNSRCGTRSNPLRPTGCDRNCNAGSNARGPHLYEMPLTGCLKPVSPGARSACACVTVIYDLGRKMCLM